jgi:tyrosyl-tRNA synthetase
MAREVVDLYHGPGAGAEAEARFDRVHRRHDVPADVETVAIPGDAIHDGAVWLPRLLATLGLASSNADARRQIEQGGVRLNGEPVTDATADLPLDRLRGAVVDIGRKRFVRLV